MIVINSNCEKIHTPNQHQYDCVDEWNLEPCKSAFGVLKSTIQIQSSPLFFCLKDGLFIQLSNQ